MNHILLLDKNDLYDYMFSDLKNSNVEILYFSYEIKSKFIKKICKIHRSIKLSKKIRLPLKELWFKRTNIYSKLKSKNIKSLLFTDSSIVLLTKKELNRIRNEGCRISVIYLNPISSPGGRFAYNHIKGVQIDSVFSVDPQDCKKYGYNYTLNVYSYNRINEYKVEYECFFAGRAKNRLKMILDIAKKFQEQNRKIIFFIVDVRKEEMESIPGVIYNKYISYSEYLRYLAKSKSILEILQEGQSGITFRCYEAYLYRKVLVTNNKFIPKNFGDMDVLPVENLKMNIANTMYTIDYNKFSPLKLISQLDKEIRDV